MSIAGRRPIDDDDAIVTIRPGGRRSPGQRNVVRDADPRQERLTDQHMSTNTFTAIRSGATGSALTRNATRGRVAPQRGRCCWRRRTPACWRSRRPVTFLNGGRRDRPRHSRLRSPRRHVAGPARDPRTPSRPDESGRATRAVYIDACRPVMRRPPSGARFPRWVSWGRAVATDGV